MAKKSVKKNRKIRTIETPIEKQIEGFGEEVAEGVEEIEQWIIERRKFLIKLAWVVGLILVLLIVSSLFLNVKGFG